MLSGAHHAATCLSISLGNATAPEFQPPVYCLLPAIWHWLGSWLTPARGCQAAMLPNGAGVGSGRGWFYGQDQEM